MMMLDQAFSVPQAPPQNRVHRRAAQEVLKRLLPEEGVPIKGHMVLPVEALLEASGYSARPGEFQELMWILDHELRLVTPADARAWVEDGDGNDPTDADRAGIPPSPGPHRITSSRTTT